LSGIGGGVVIIEQAGYISALLGLSLSGGGGQAIDFQVKAAAFVGFHLRKRQTRENNRKNSKTTQQGPLILHQRLWRGGPGQ
jgi:hypothetical protein